MEWDNHDLLPSMHFDEKFDDESASDPVLPLVSESLPLPSKTGQLLEVNYNGKDWCSQESGYLEWEGTPGSDASTSFTSGSILSPLQEKRYDTKK